MAATVTLICSLLKIEKSRVTKEANAFIYTNFELSDFETELLRVMCEKKVARISENGV